MRPVCFPLVLLGACHGGATGNVATPPDLERAAIEVGAVPDPAGADITGLYARDSDRVCLVPAGRAFRIGLTVDYDLGQSCSGIGRATRAGDSIHVELDDAKGCSFDARFEGDRIALPARLPAACAANCAGRTTLEAISVDRLSESAAEAATLRDSRGRQLCGG